MPYAPMPPTTHASVGGNSVAPQTPPGISNGSPANAGLCEGARFDHITCSYSVTQADHAFDLGAMLTAEECAFLFEPMTDDMNTAIVAARSQRMDCALKAVEGMGPAVHAHLKRLVIVISAGFASGHDCLPFCWGKMLEPITRAIPRRFRAVRCLVQQVQTCASDVCSRWDRVANATKQSLFVDAR
jgi:hypothetical protein